MTIFVVKITSAGYEPKRYDVQRGDEVWWLNVDTSVHSAVSDDGTSFETPELRRGESAPVAITFGPGAFPYHDRTSPHAGVLMVS